MRTALTVIFFVGVLLCGTAPAREAETSWLPTLITESPEEGFALAIVMARRGVTTIQQDRATLHALRPDYAHDSESLIEASGVIAAYFATIAAANDYWRVAVSVK